MANKGGDILTRFVKIISEEHLRPQDVKAFAAANFLEAHIHADEMRNRRVLIRSRPDDNRHFMNGVIVSRQGILVYPPRMLKRIDTRSFNKLHMLDAKKYTITEAANGTMVTLYNWDNQWCLGTTRGVYVNDYAIVGSRSLMLVFEELLARYGLQFSDFDRLMSYTFIMCHPDYHVLPIESLYFVRAWNIQLQRIDLCPGFLIGLQQPVVTIAEANMTARISYFSRHCIGATDRFTRGDFSQIAGFIMRANTGQSRPSSRDCDYYIESDITHFLQEFMYKSLRHALVDAQYRHMHFILHVYLNFTQNSILSNMICQRYGDDFAELDVVFKSLNESYDQYLSSGRSIAIPECEALFSRLALDKVAAGEIAKFAYFELIFKALKSIR